LPRFAEGAFGEFTKDGVVVTAEDITDLGELTWTLVKHGEMLWQIAVPNRTVTEFKGAQDARVWDSFLRYREYFPSDVNFTTGKSDEATDWFYMQPSVVKGGVSVRTMADHV
jgi:hypothetical protein